MRLPSIKGLTSFQRVELIEIKNQFIENPPVLTAVVLLGREKCPFAFVISSKRDIDCILEDEDRAGGFVGVYEKPTEGVEQFILDLCEDICFCIGAVVRLPKEVV